MKSTRNILPLLLFAAVAASSLCGCSGKSDKKEVSHSNLPEDVKPVAIAILNDSPSEFASAVSYPVQRPYPLKNVNDSAEMVKYYNTLVDDSLKNKIKQSPDTLWQEEGWRGWTFDNGSYFWIDSGKVYEIGYVSKREAQMLDSLRHQEISTLEPSMRKGWIPVICVIDIAEGDVFRIDTDTVTEPPKYRLARYAPGTDLSGVPTIVLYGTLDTEGTMNNRYYHFSDSIGNDADYMPDLEEDTVPTIEMRKNGLVKKYPVKPGYWLDTIAARRKEMMKNEVNDSKNVSAHKDVFINGGKSLSKKEEPERKDFTKKDTVRIKNR